MKAIPIENHPQDSRVKICEDGLIQTLSSKMGTGGGNVPLILQPIAFRKVRKAQSSTDFETWEECEETNTLNLFDMGDTRTSEIILTPPNT